MKQLISTALLSMVLFVGSDARAKDAIRVQVRVEPAADAAELQRLMRQNSVRIALQRHRLWQAAYRHEEARRRAQVKPRFQTRSRRAVMTQPMTRAMTKPTTSPSRPTAINKPGNPQLRPDTAPSPRAASVTSLRQLLRRGRVGSPQDLEQKLKNRIQKLRQQREQLRNRGPRDAAMSPGRGGRSGR